VPPIANEVESIVAKIEERILSAASASTTVTDEELGRLILDCLPERSSGVNRYGSSIPIVVESISIRGIRSFGPLQTLRPSEGLTIIYAGNGHGKTSLTDALELLTEGITTRQMSLPNAAAEVKDEDHIAHLKPNGEPDPNNPPRVTVSFREGERLRTCEWTSFKAPATGHPDIQVLPRRKLRELVNAKRTERTQPLGAALGLAETIDLWTAVSKELKRRSSAVVEDVPDYLRLLKDEVPVQEDDSDLLKALQHWQIQQYLAPALLHDLPEATSWSLLARSISDCNGLREQPEVLSAEHQNLLSSFLSVVEPGTDCPACAQAKVPQYRLEEVKRILAETRESEVLRERIAAVKSRSAELSSKVAAWLQLADPVEKASDLPDTWKSAVSQLRQTLEGQGSLLSAGWARKMASVLSDLNDVHTRLIGSSQTNSLESRDFAVRRVRSDSSQVLQSYRNLEFLETVFAPLLARAGQRIRVMLFQRIDNEFEKLQEPINEWLSILGPQGTPSITLNPVQTAHRPSLDLRVAKYPEDIAAPHVSGHFSDAQIDMLGMSTHLARIERDHPGAMIVIDDPSDMLDYSARRIFARDGIERLLRNESSPSHQVVILTHDDQLVRELWDAHRGRQPATVQDTIERTRDEDDGDDFSILVSRSAAMVTARAKQLVDDFWGTHQDRVWFRAALAAHTRQAVEMCAKDISTLLGPAGLSLHPESRRTKEHEDLGKVSDKVRATLREVSECWCSAGLHRSARKQVDELRDLFSKDTSAALNPGAHADVVLPEAAESKAMLDRLTKIVDLLAAPQGRSRSRWTTESPLAVLLQSGNACPTCMVER